MEEITLDQIDEVELTDIDTEPQVNLISNAVDLVPDSSSDSNIFDRIGLFAKEVGNQFKVQATEPIKEFAQGGIGIMKSYNQAISYAGRALKFSNDMYRPMLENNIYTKAHLDIAEKIANTMAEYGDKYNKYWQGESDFLAKNRDKETWEGTFIENPNVTRIMSSVAQSIPMFAVGSTLGAVTGSTVAGASILGASEGLGTYQEALDKGKSDKRALLVGLASGIASSVSEIYLGSLTDILGKNPSSILQSIWKESLQEGSQTVINNVIRKFGIDNTINLIDGFVESMVVGGLTGGLMTGIANTTKKQAVIEAQRVLPQEDFNAMLEITGNIMIDNAEAIDTALKTQLDDVIQIQATQQEMAQGEQIDTQAQLEATENALTPKGEPQVVAREIDLSEVPEAERPLYEEALKYDSAEEFVKGQIKYHGQPLTGKYGNTEEFEYFELGEINPREEISSNAFYFTNSEGSARGYGDRVYERLLYMRNPLLLTTPEENISVVNKAWKNILDIAEEEGIEISKEKILDVLNDTPNDIGDSPSLQWLYDINKKLPTIVRNGIVNWAKENGYDSLKLLDTDRDGNYIADVVFDSNQIFKVEDLKSQLTDIYNKAHEMKKVKVAEFKQPQEEIVSQVIDPEQQAYLDKYRKFLQSPFMKEQIGELTEKQLDGYVYIKKRGFERENAYRKFLKLPALNKMTDAQVDTYINELSKFEDKDIFLTETTLKAAQKIGKMKNVMTHRQAIEMLSKELNVKPEALTVMAQARSDLDVYKYDTVLARKNPLYEYIVKRTQTLLLSAEEAFIEQEKIIDKLASKANKSIKRNIFENIVNSIVPQNERIMNYLEASDIGIDELGNPTLTKEEIAKTMTKEELEYADYIASEYTKAYEYLLKINALYGSRFTENYFTHIRRGFLETMKDDGFVEAVKNMMTQQKEDMAVFEILDQRTGSILPKEKFFANTIFRSGELTPSKNVTRAVKQYMKTFQRKVAFDQMIPELDIYVQALTPTKLTPKGLEMDTRFKEFVYKYINNKKGRQESFGGTIKQGGIIDTSLRMGNTFVALLDLGFSPLANIAAAVGEQVTTFQSLGVKNYAMAFKRRLWDTGIARLIDNNAIKILEDNKAFIGKNIWEELAEVDQPFGEVALKTMFGGFAQSSVEANKIFLLGSITEAELKQGKLSNERLAELRLEAGRWRDMGKNIKSIVGSTSLGSAVTKYKSWAVPILTTSVSNLNKIAKDLSKKDMSLKDKLTSKEIQETVREITSISAILFVGALVASKDDDESFISKLKQRVYRESLSILQGLDISFYLSTPRLLSFLYQFSSAITSIIKLEKYKKRDKKKGIEKNDLKGIRKIKSLLTPSVVRQLQSDTKKEE